MGKKLLKIHKIDFSNEDLAYRWYPVTTAINYERKVAESLKPRFESMGIPDQFAEVLVPIKEWEEIVTGSKPKKDGTFSQRRVKRSENVFLTGYIFVKMAMTAQSWNVVRQTTGCSGYLKADGRPGPIEEKEILAIKERLGLVVAKEEATKDFKGVVGGVIKITSIGGMEATITEIFKEKGTLKAINQFGKKIEVDIASVEVV